MKNLKAEIMAINDVSIVHDAVLRMKQILASGVDDPLSRGGGGSTFILANFPERKVEYPIITVRANLGAGTKMGMQSEGIFVPINIFVDVWSMYIKEKDCLSGSVFDVLRDNQLGIDASVGSGTSTEKLYDFNIASMVDIDEPGKKGLHRKSMQFNYKYMTQG